MPVDGSGAYLPPKPKKPKQPKSVSSGSSSSDATPHGYGSAPKTPSIHPTYKAPTYTPPPSYARPPKPRPLDTRTEASFLPEFKLPKIKSNPFHDLMGQLKSDAPDFSADPIHPDGSNLTPELQDFMEKLRQATHQDTELAPKGYTPGAEKLGPGEFAWVPERFKTNKNGRLKNYWDADFIQSSVSDFAYDSQYQSFLNDMMEKQFQDREKWLLGRNERHYDHVKEVLKRAGDAAFNGNFDYLAKYQEKHPNFTFDTPTYRSQFGITPDDIVQNWMHSRQNITDPYMRGALRSRMDKMRKHYERLQRGPFFSYRATAHMIDQAVDKYTEKYNDSVKFGLNSTDEDKHSAAENAGTPLGDHDWRTVKLPFGNIIRVPVGKDTGPDPSTYDKLADEALDPGLSLLVSGITKKKDVIADAREKGKHEAMTALGTSYIPSVKQMLMAKVQSGELDPRNHKAVEAEIHRLRNPYHPDTRAMYVAFAMQRNPNFDVKGKGLPFINEPIVKDITAKNKSAKWIAEQNTKFEESQAAQDSSHHDGVWDSITDVFKDTDIQGYATQPDKSRFNNGQDVNAIGWTFDKLMRLNYGVAGFAKGWYSLDKSQSGPGLIDPFNHFTGQPWGWSLDELWHDPSKVGQPFKEAYQQVFRGSNLPGTSEDTIPVTWPNVIQNNALRDSDHNLYDQSWYQHVAGFAFDVGTDPLNFVGLGVVNDALKTPTRISKALKDADKGSATVEPIDVLNKIQAPNLSPVAEKVYKTDQSLRRLGDSVEGVEYAKDDAIFEGAIDAVDHKQVVDDINHQLNELRIQKAQLKNDVGVESFHNEIVDIAASDPYVAASRNTQVRVGRLAAQTRTTIHGTDLVNPGGRFWRDWIKPYSETAKMRGFSTTRYADTTIGRAAKKAEQDLNKLLDDIDSGALHATDAAVVKQKQYLEDTINKAYETDEVGVQHAKNEPNIEAYRKAGEPGFTPTFDPVAAFAKSVELSKDEFLKAYHITERDVHDALLYGSELSRQGDPAINAKWLRAQSAKDNAQRALKSKSTNASYRSANAKKLAKAYKTISEITLDGAFRHLDRLREGRAAGALPPAYRDSLMDYHGLSQLDEEITARLENEGSSAVDDIGEYLGTMLRDTEHSLNEVDWKSVDFRGTSIHDLEDLLRKTGSKSHNAFWGDALQELRSQMKSLDDEIRDFSDNFAEHSTSLPPAKAYKVEKILDPDSVFRTKDGLNEDKIRSAFRVRDDHTIGYDAPKGAKPSDYEFLDTLRGAIESDYDDLYALEKTKIVNSAERETGMRAAKLGPRPTVESLRKQYPNIFKNHVKGGLGKDVHYVKEQGGAKGVPGVFAEEAPEIAVGKKTRKQETLSEFIARKQKKWDKAHARALELDAAEYRRTSNVDFKVTREQAGLIKQKAFKGAVDAAISNLKKGKIKRVPGNARMTVNESAQAAKKAVNESVSAELAELDVKAAETTVKAELDTIEAQRKALLKTRNEHLAAIEKARVTAHETSKQTAKRISEDEIIQIATMPPRMTGRMIQLRLMGMRKNLQFTHSLFDGAESAAKLIPQTTRSKFAEVFWRPSKQLDSRESIMFRAMWESKTPVIIKAHLSRLSERFREIGETERRDMFKAFRNDVEYEGAHMRRYDEAMQEVKEVEDIFNGKNEFYWFEDKRKPNGPSALTPWEVNNYLPDQYKINIKVLNRHIADSKDGRVTAQMVIDSIKSNGGKIEDLLDPYRFSWVMRLAADQSRQYRALNHLIEQTFGIEIPVKGSKRKVVLKLEKKHGWVKDGNFMYPPEALNDIKKLREFARPGDPQNKISRLIDTALGYWKQSMTTYNPGYYTRNGIGEIMTSWLDGVYRPKYYRMAYRVHRYSKNEDKNLAVLIERWSMLKDQIPVDIAKGSEVLFRLKNGEKITVDEALKQYIHMGLKATFANTDIGRGLRSVAGEAMHKTKLGKGLARTSEAVHDAGEGFEDYLRMAHFLHAMENSGASSIHQAAMHAAERVRRSHFDYTDFSTFEKSVMLRLFPFYKWTRRGAPLMFAHLFLTPGKMGVLPKAMDTISGLGFDPVGMVNDDPVFSTKDVNEDTNGGLPDYQGIAPSWVRDLFAYQISPASDDEYGNYFRIQTPQVDGLNAVLGATPIPGTDHPANPLDAFAQSGGYPLLNPLLKGAIELGQNRSMDPSSPYEIYGGDYNESNNISTPEAIGNYIARNVSPDLGFLSKLAKNGDLGPLSYGDGSYKDSQGYNSTRDIASFLTGLGFYQGKPEGELPANKSAGPNSRSVGMYTLDDLISTDGRKPAQKGTKKKSKNRPGGQPTIDDILKPLLSQGDNAVTSDGSSGWIPNKYGNSGSGWIPNKYGNGGYGNGSGYSSGGYSGGSSYSASSSSVSTDFLDLILRLIKAADQGEIYTEGDVKPPK